MDPLWVLTFISHLEHLPDYLEKRGVGGLIVTSYAVTRLLCKSRNMLLMIFFLLLLSCEPDAFI